MVENAIQIALNYLERSGEIDDYNKTCDFLIAKIEFMIRQGQRNKLLLVTTSQVRPLADDAPRHNAVTELLLAWPAVAVLAADPKPVELGDPKPRCHSRPRECDVCECEEYFPQR